MPGLVRLVSVKPGQAVVKGEALAVTEAMKMEHTIRAPRDGTIESVHIEAGQQIQEGAMLVSLVAVSKSPAA